MVKPLKSLFIVTAQRSIPPIIFLLPRFRRHKYCCIARHNQNTERNCTKYIAKVIPRRPATQVVVLVFDAINLAIVDQRRQVIVMIRRIRQEKLPVTRPYSERRMYTTLRRPGETLLAGATGSRVSPYIPARKSPVQPSLPTAIHTCSSRGSPMDITSPLCPKKKQYAASMMQHPDP